MINETLYNITVPTFQAPNTSGYLCELNQYALIEATNKLPIVCLYLSLAIFFILGFNWIVLPFLHKWKYYDDLKEALPGMAFALSIWLPLILMYFTMDLNAKSFKTLEMWLTIFAGLLVLSVAIYYRKKIIDFIKGINMEEKK